MIPYVGMAFALIVIWFLIASIKGSLYAQEVGVVSGLLIAPAQQPTRQINFGADAQPTIR